MKYSLLFHFAYMWIFDASTAYRILAIFPLPGRSHMVMFEHLLKELVARGHEVDVVSHFPQKTPLPRYNDISVRGSMPIFVNNISMSLIETHLQSNFDTIQFVVNAGGIDPCKVLFNTSQVKALKTTTRKYDLLISEIFGSDCMLGFAHLFKIPVISMTSSVNLPWGGDRIGNPDNPSYIPNYFVPYLSKMSLMERLVNTVVLVMTKYWYAKSNVQSNLVARDFFGPDLPPLEELAYNTSLIMVNSHFSVNVARPTVQNFVEVAGLHIQKPKPLPKHLEEILTLSPEYKGVIYLSMGSMVMTETFAPEKLEALFNAFEKVPYKVLWKAKREKMPKNLEIPSNIHFEPWLPQFDVLCHPNVKLFVSHGGLMGTQEGIYCGVPRLGIPLFADQDTNLRSSEAMGLALKVYYQDITEETISGALKTLLEDPRYEQNAKEICSLFKDRPLSAMETAVYWVEYVIRHKGAPHLRSAGADLYWFQYFLLDVGLIILTTVLLALTAVYYLTIAILSKILNKNKPVIKYKSQ